MDTENLAKMAFQHVRKIYSKGLKSVTKAYYSGPRFESDHSRVELARITIRKLREDYFTRNLLTQTEFYSEAERLKAGNCGEMTQIAVRFITQHGGNAGLCVTNDIFTHMFCLLAKSSYKYPEYITAGEMDKDLWIIDPWCGICCPANLFISEFLNKMSKWTAQNKRILFNGDWVKANDPKWIECVLYSSLRILPVVIK
ncbi:hypothetical protein [Kosakonia sp. MUSA4]|uniref:hypothetical protein n=1 Tax=Kosakonia sp. MUSA4 TaxID=2067958 RepID=UPI0015975181|nr:hypothetical protein [Kosakonia sp. MUSA4]QJT80753.1 hypothetical protein C0557_12050 [Kosakonia sp. MUSA4]